jgi:hypothetical protein
MYLLGKREVLITTMRTIEYHEHFQYGQLAQALVSLNFSEHTGTNEFGAPYRAFYNRECDALITVPDKPDDAIRPPANLWVAEHTVDGRGVANRETLFRLLREAPVPEVSSALTKSDGNHP